MFPAYRGIADAVFGERLNTSNPPHASLGSRSPRAKLVHTMAVSNSRHRGSIPQMLCIQLFAALRWGAGCRRAGPLGSWSVKASAGSIP
jgi:hypothetical protein